MRNKKQTAIMLIITIVLSSFAIVFAESAQDILKKVITKEIVQGQELEEFATPISIWLGLESDLIQSKLQSQPEIILERVERIKSNLVDSEGNITTMDLIGTIYETEPNYNISIANMIYPNYLVSGTITDVAYDLDCYRLQLSQYGRLDLMGMWAGDYYNYGWEDDLYVGLYDSNDEMIDWSMYVPNDDGTATTYMSWELPAGTYYIYVMANDDYEYLYVGEPYMVGAFFEPIVTSVPVTSVSLNKSSTSLSVGNTETLTATVFPTNATNKNVSWTSSDNSIATVNSGLVTGVGVGTAIITVTTQDGGKQASCTIIVTNPIILVESVSLSKESMSLDVGSTETLTATISPANATNKNVSWTSSNNSIATVNNGFVTGAGVGTAIITVTTQDGGKKASCTVTVLAEPTGIIDSFIMDCDGQKIIVPLGGIDGYAFAYSTQNNLYQYLKGSNTYPLAYGIQSGGKYMPMGGIDGYAMNYSLYSSPLEAMNNTSAISASTVNTFYVFDGFDSFGNAILIPLTNTVESFNPTITAVVPGVYNIAFTKEIIESRFSGITVSTNLNVAIGSDNYTAVYTAYINDIGGPGWLVFNIQGFDNTEIKAGKVTIAQ